MELAFVVAFAALVVVPLAQVPLVAYLSRYVELDGDAELPPPGEGYVTYGTAAARPATNGGGDDALADGRVRCPHCGRGVDATFDYCGQCAGRLDVRPGGGR